MDSLASMESQSSQGTCHNPSPVQLSWLAQAVAPAATTTEAPTTAVPLSSSDQRDADQHDAPLEAAPIAASGGSNSVALDEHGFPTMFTAEAIGAAKPIEPLWIYVQLELLPCPDNAIGFEHSHCPTLGGLVGVDGAVSFAPITSQSKRRKIEAQAMAASQKHAAKDKVAAEAAPRAAPDAAAPPKEASSQTKKVLEQRGMQTIIGRAALPFTEDDGRMELCGMTGTRRSFVAALSNAESLLLLDGAWQCCVVARPRPR